MASSLCLQMPDKPSADRVKAWCYKTMGMVCAEEWELALQVGSGTHCQHGLLLGRPASAHNMCPAPFPTHLLLPAASCMLG